MLSVRRLIQMATESPFMDVGRQQNREIRTNNKMLRNCKTMES